MVDSIELLNDLDEVIRRKQQEIREGKQAKPTPANPKPELIGGDATRIPKPTRDPANRANEDERTGESVVRDEEKSTGESVVRDEEKSTGESVVRDDEKSAGESGAPDENPPMNTEAPHRGNRIQLLNDLNDLIKSKEAEASNKKPSRPRKPKPTRAAVNRANGANSQGPTTPEGKARASANSLKHGFFANVEKLNPQDAPVYQRLVHDLRHTLHPDNPVEELAIRELAMLSARLQRLEAAEYALLCSEIEAPAPQPNTTPNSPERKGRSSTSCEDSSVLRDQEDALDSRSLAAAFLNTQDHLERLHKIEVHLRRAYNRTWDRLRIMQKDRRKLTPEEMRKRTHQWVSSEQERTSGLPTPNPYDTARDFDDDFPPLPPGPSSSDPNNRPSPTDSDPNPTPKESPSA